MRSSVLGLLLGSFVLACGDAPPPATPAPAPAPSPSPLPAETAPTASAAPAPAPAPSPEDLKKEEAKKQLAADRAKWEADHKAELARWTPEIRAAAKALADKAYPSGKAALQATIAGKHRRPEAVARDKYRHPLETLDFLGFKPNMTVLDIGPGDGWYTEILAPAVAKSGKYLATSGDPNGPIESRGTYYAQRWKGFVETSPEAYGKIQTIVLDGKAPKLGLDGTVDMVLLMRGMHGWKNDGTTAAWLAEVHKALKPGGVFGVEEHRAAADGNPDETAKKGYLPEKWVIDTVEAAGFKLAAKSEVNANPRDTKDYADGVWTLPPTLRLGDKDRDKYLTIGESDRMTLKFVKVAPKTEKAADKPADKKPADKPAKK